MDRDPYRGIWAVQTSVSLIQAEKLQRELALVKGNLTVMSQMLNELIPGQSPRDDEELLRVCVGLTSAFCCHDFNTGAPRVSGLFLVYCECVLRLDYFTIVIATSEFRKCNIIDLSVPLTFQKAQKNVGRCCKSVWFKTVHSPSNIY